MYFDAIAILDVCVKKERERKKRNIGTTLDDILLSKIIMMLNTSTMLLPYFFETIATLLFSHTA